MQTKNHKKIPEGLAEEITKRPGLSQAWDKLRPSCQRDYALLVKKAEDEDERARRIKHVVKLTEEYAARHPNKYKNRKINKKR